MYKPTITNLYVDECLTGFGGACGSLVYVLSLGRLVSLPTPLFISKCPTYKALSLWKHRLSGKAVVIHCDNMAVVCSLNSGRSWDPFVGTVARNIWLVTATYDIDLTVPHIPGMSNGRADALSRWYRGQLHHSTVSELLRHEWCSVDGKILDLNMII